MMDLELDARALAEVRRVNRILALLPRLQLKPGHVRLVQTLLGIIGLVADPLARSAGVAVETRAVAALGRTVEVRILRPPGESVGTHLAIHGGAWAVGRAHVDDRVNVEIVRDCRLTVVSVEYRLAPQVPIEACIDDCETAAAWLLASDQFPGPVTLGGESAGAHLAACTLLRLRDRNLLARVRGAVLFYGVYDLAGTASLRNAGPDTLVFDGPSCAAALRLLTPGATDSERRAPKLSPLYADLGGLPPALLLVGSKDPLIDDTLRLHAAWQRANGNADLVVAPDGPHGFNRLETAAAAKANALVRAWLAARTV